MMIQGDEKFTCHQKHHVTPSVRWFVCHPVQRPAEAPSPNSHIVDSEVHSSYLFVTRPTTTHHTRPFHSCT